MRSAGFVMFHRSLEMLFEDLNLSKRENSYEEEHCIGSRALCGSNFNGQ